MTQANNPLHGITLRAIVEDLVERRGFEDLGARIRINCFTFDPSIKSSLKFLRKNDWARAKVEELYLADLEQNELNVARNKKRNLRRAAQRAYAKEAASEVASAPEADTGTSEQESE